MFLAQATGDANLEESLDAELEELREMGYSEEQVDNYLLYQVERSTTGDVELFEENIEVFDVFRSVMTQFNLLVLGSGKVVPTGLNYTSVISYLTLYYKPKKAKLLLDDLSVIEHSYIKGRQQHNG